MAEPESRGTNWNTGASGWPSPYVKVTEARQRLCRETEGFSYSKTVWTQYGATCSTWPCLRREIGQDELQTPLWTSVVLWFSEPELYCYGQRLSGEELPSLLQRLIILPSDGDADKVAFLVDYTEAVPEAVGSSDLGVQLPNKAYPVQTSAKRPSKNFYLKGIYL